MRRPRSTAWFPNDSFGRRFRFRGHLGLRVFSLTRMGLLGGELIRPIWVAEIVSLSLPHPEFSAIRVQVASQQRVAERRGRA